MSGIKTRRHFTEAAREAAALARQRKRELRELHPEAHLLEMVVVRNAAPPRGFGWQIRRFGHLRPVAESPSPFGDPAEAGHSGRAALAAMKGGAPGP